MVVYVGAQGVINNVGKDVSFETVGSAEKQEKALTVYVGNKGETDVQKLKNDGSGEVEKEGGKDVDAQDIRKIAREPRT